MIPQKTSPSDDLGAPGWGFAPNSQDVSNSKYDMPKQASADGRLLQKMVGKSFKHISQMVI